MVDAKMHQNAQVCMLKFKIFPKTMPRTPLLGRGYGTPKHSGAVRSRASLGASGPLIVPPMFFSHQHHCII